MTVAQSLRTPSLWIALAVAFVVGAVGGALTPIGDWYRALVKPAFQPPDWAFGPAWTVIFLLTAYSAHRLWEANQAGSSERRQLLALVLFNALLNVGWSFLFFTQRRPDIALYEAFVLLLSVLLLIIAPSRKLPRIRWLLAPYAAWVCFAITLNAAIVQLNAPF
ncbi:MAG: TspO/MBR family protein [Pseudomonadota bacterium]